jgi:sec-independent protein translocase protein TatA
MGLDNPLHIAFLVVILLLVFGAKRLPEIGRSLGGGMREFKEGISGDSKKPAITQATQQRQDSAQGAAQAFGEGAPAPVPVEPSQPTPHQQ